MDRQQFKTLKANLRLAGIARRDWPKQHSEAKSSFHPSKRLRKRDCEPARATTKS